MSPFMQELVSFISIMLGIVTLTAWAMWLFLRPSGEDKVKEFASESVRDGMTITAMENNELKNTIIRLERELKVLMNAGYSGKGEAEVEKEVDEKEEKYQQERVDEKVLKAEEKVQQLEKVLKQSSKKEKAAKSKKPEETKESRSAVPGAIKDRNGSSTSTSKPSKSSKPSKPSKSSKSYRPPKPTKLEKQEKKSSAKKETLTQVETVRPATVTPLSEAKRITDKAEKKKIADYLASVAEETERQMKEVEALEEISQLSNGESYPDDDLKKIKGIGLHLEGHLKRAGITSYQQIARFSDEEIQKVSAAIGSYPRRIRREKWVEQAQALADK